MAVYPSGYKGTDSKSVRAVHSRYVSSNLTAAVK